MSSSVRCCKPNSSASRQLSRKTGSHAVYKSKPPSKLPILIKKYNCPKITEPLPVAQDDILSLVQFEKNEQRLQEDMRERENRIYDIIGSLKLIRESVEKAFKSQMMTQAEIENVDPSNKERLNNLLQLKCRQQNELMECLQLEDKYLQELQCQQRALHEYNVKSQTLATEKIDKKIDEIYLQYEGRKDFLYRNRLQRESTCKSNARKQKYRAVKTLIVRSLDQGLDDVEQKRKPVSHMRKDVMKRVRYRYRATGIRFQRGKLDEFLTYQGRQHRQQQALLALRDRINLQKAELLEQNQLQTKRHQEELERKEAQRKRLIALGENPYIVDEFMRVEAKIHAKERREQESRALAVEKIQREVIDRERAQRRAVMTRKKWEKFWASKAKEKRRIHYEKYVKPFLAQPKPSRAERWFKVVQDTYGYEPGKPPPCLKPIILDPSEVAPPSIAVTSTKSAPTTPLLGAKDVAEGVERSLTAAKESHKHLTAKEDAHKRGSTKYRRKSTQHIAKGGRLSRVKKKSDDGGGEHKLIQIDEMSVDATEEEEGMVVEDKPQQLNVNQCAIIGPQGDWLSLMKDTLGQNVPKAPGPTDAFTWSPQVIKFENYDVGKVYRMRVYVTNRSKQRLKYYFREMTEMGESKPQIPPNPPPSAIEITISPKQSISNYDSEDTQGLDKSKDSGKTPRRKKKVPDKASEKTLTDKSSEHSEQNFTKESSKQIPRQASEDVEALKAKFYLLNDCVKVNFNVPYPINSGLTHSFEVIFKPPAYGDWTGKLKFTSELGTFEIPVEIYKRRFDPQLACKELIFYDAVATVTAIKRVKLKNIGGLPGFLHCISQPHKPRIYNEEEISPSLEFIKTPNPMLEESGDEAVAIPEHHNGLPTHKGKKDKIDKRKSKTEEHTDGTGKEAKKTPKSGRKHHGGDHSGHLVKYNSTKEFTINSTMNVADKSPTKSGSLRKTRTEENLMKQILHEIIVDVTDSIFVTYIDEMNREIQPGQALTLVVHFRPPFVSHFTSKLELTLGKSYNETSTMQLPLDLTGLTIENPVYVQPLNADFRICTVNHVYQHVIKVHTTSAQRTGKVKARVPNALRGYVEVFPHEFMTLHSTRPVEFSVYFTPRRLMLTSPDLFREFFDPETHILDFPVYFHLKYPFKLPTPITATCMAVLSDSQLTVEPDKMDMGDCRVSETVKSEIFVTNPTMAAHKIGFIDLPDEIIIQPNYGFATILPDETMKFEVLLTPDVKTPEGPLILGVKMVSFGKEEYRVQVACMVKRTTVKLSQYRILFPSTCCGSTCSTTVGIKSIGIPQKGLLSFPTFQVDLDPDLPLKIFPQSGFLEPGKESKLLITFEPTVTVEDVRKTYVQSAQDHYNELISRYQRELAAINLHLESSWMLEELAKSPNPGLPPTTSGLDLSVQTGSQGSLNSKTQKSSSGGTGSDSKPGSAPSDGAKSGSNTSKKSAKRPGSAVKSPRKDSKGSKGKGRRSADAPIAVTDGKEESMPAKDKVVRQLERRKSYVMSKIATTFEVPDPKNLLPDSVEFNRVKREYLRNLPPFSKVYQVPIVVRDAMSSETAILTISCPTQRPDIILLDSTVVDFGKVYIGRRNRKEVHVFNSSQESLSLKMSVMNPYGPFVHINALRDLAPEHVYTLKVRFEPYEPGEYEEHVTIYGGDSTVILTLKGIGREHLSLATSRTGTSTGNTTTAEEATDGNLTSPSTKVEASHHKHKKPVKRKTIKN